MGKSLHRAILAALLALAVCLSCLALYVAPALACGGFFRKPAGKVERPPSLAYEQTLIVFDEAAGREEFVREVVFRDSAEPFGFVVPTPARPTVRAVKKSPFASLHRSFPFAYAPPRTRGPARSAKGGGGVARSPAPVQVLEVRQVGSFKSFVLAASDERALADWLAKNGFVSTPTTQAWLAHYVKLEFYYVAMRYEPRDAAEGQTTAETVRISFDTPLPYYPYLEPAAEPGQPDRPPRMLDVWLASKRCYAPVSLDTSGPQPLWVRPLQAGLTHGPGASVRADLAAALGEDRGLLPADGELVVQRFGDQKKSRAGFGDVVFVPTDLPALSDQQRAKLKPLAKLLDPSLSGAP